MTDRRDILDAYLAPAAPPRRSTDPLDEALNDDARDRAARVYYAVRRADPDAAARANRLARQTGLPGDVVERNLGSVEADTLGTSGAERLLSTSSLARWYSDPRQAAASKDDLDALSGVSTLIGPNSLGNQMLGITPERARLGTQLDQSFARESNPRDPSYFENLGSRVRARERGRREAVEAQRPRTTTGSWWRGIGIGTLGGFQQARIGAKMYMSDALGFDSLIPKQQAEYQDVQDVIQSTTPRDLFSFGRSLYGGFVSTGQAIPALAATIATLPAGGAGGLLVAGGQTGLGAYGKYRARGATPNEALLGGTLEGGIEAITEKIPLNTLVGGFGKKGVGRFIGEFALKEMGGEQLATLGQDAVDTAVANPNATWSQYVADRPQAAIDTAVAVILQTGIIGGGSAVARALRPVERDIEQATDGVAGANLLDSVIARAEASKLRQRDPESFRQFVEQHTDGGPAEHVYLPAEKVRELMQSDGYEPNDWAWAPDLAEQVAQAGAAGGDVVLPLAGVAAHLAGTRTWEAIRPDVRLSPGGMSEREANDFADAYAEIMEQQGRAAASELEAERAASAPERRVYEEVLGQARDAGFNLRASQAYAELWAQHYSTRAARLGVDAWDAFQRSNVSIRQELPATLDAYRKADTLDLAINAMRRGGRSAKPSGPSLLEWIAARGGIEDRGGDIAAMGGDKWHRGRPGRRKLVRTTDPDQISMLGEDGQQNSNSPDELALRAQEAGYLLPGDRPAISDLLDAISTELRGSPVYSVSANGGASTEAQEATARAADELRALLETAGLDPDTATRDEIDAAVGAAANSAARALEQAIYHGSPHVFDRFSLEHIGSGEGAQAYGWGLYFAGRKQIAEYYRRVLAGGPQYSPADIAEYFTPGRLIDGYGGKDKVIAFKPGPEDAPWDWAVTVQRVGLDGEPLRGERPRAHSTQPDNKQMRAVLGREPSIKPGRLYHVEIPEDVEYLLWDKPLSQQQPQVVDAIVKAGVFEGATAEDIRELGVTGEDLYRSMVAKRLGGPVLQGGGNGGHERAASLALREAGIAGIKYLDGASRGDGDGSYNYVVFDDSRVSIRTYEQEARGRLDLYADGQRIIRLFEGRDLSTLLHETGHLWLEELREDAERAGAPVDLKAQWQTVRAWFAANGHVFEADADIPTEAHELWARGMERYFMEGKAPSPALTGAFQSFRAWLLRIYQLVQRLNVPLTDDVRDVMARMLATDDAISAAAEDAEAKALFTTAAEASMSDAEFEAYSRTADQARTEAFDALLYRTMETVRRARTKEWKEQRANVRADVASRISQRPEFRALAILRARDDTRVALDRTALVEEFGEDALAMIPKGVPPTVVTIGGVHPDILAEQVGFASGRELVATLMGLQQRENDLRAVGDKRSAFNEAVDAEADSIMRDRHGDVLSDGSIEEEALAAIHNDTRATVIASELAALGRKTGHAVTPWKLARDWAQRTVREGLIGEQATGAAIARHQRAEAKAAREAEKAMLAGDTDAAFRAKQQQMLSNALFRAAKDAKDNVDRVVKRLGRLAVAKSQPSMDQEYLDRIHDLLEAYDMRPRSVRAVAERESFAAWVAAKEAAGEEVHVPARLRDANTVNFTKLTVDDLLALDDTVASIAHLGRVKKKLVLAREERDFDETVEQFVTAAEALPERKFTAHRNERRTKLGKAKAFARDFGAMMVKMEFLADDLDNGDPNGVMNRLLVQGATEAANHQARLTDKVLAPLARLYNDMPAEQQRRMAERVTVPEFVEVNPETLEIVPSIYSRSELIAVALNTGTDSNFDKMVRGESLAFRQMPDLQWSRGKVEAVLARELNADDWRFVQAVWRQIDSLWPEIERAERAITGVVPERVEPRRVQTPFGEIDGSYYPLVYDPARSTRAADNYQDDAAKLLGQMGRAVSTPKGHTIERTEYAAPLMLALEPVLFNHVRRVTTRIAYGAWIRDVLKFTNDGRVRRMIDRKLGPEYHAQIAHWLRGQVNEAAIDTSSIRALDQILRKFRVNATLVGLGFRMTTMVAQVGGLPNSANQIGAKWLARGMGEAAANGGAARDFVFARSTEMAHRAHDFDRDVAAAFRDMEGSTSPLDRARAWAFWGIGKIDVYLVAMPTWLGGYRRAIDEGMSEADAAAFADKAVRKSQGSGRPKDLAAIQNASEGYRVMTLFYSFFSVLYNQQREMIRDGQKGNYHKAAMTAWWVMVAGPLISAVLVGDWPQDEESWGAWAVRKVFFGLWAGVPGVRDVANVMERRISGQFSEFGAAPIYRSFEGLMRVGDDAVRKAEGKDPSQRWLRTAIETPGYFLGLPTGQAAATADYLYAVASDEQHPEDIQDVAAGLAKGRRDDQE